MMRNWIDTHVHLLYPNRLQYPWALNIPTLNQAFHLEHYQQVAAPLGITQALHMEVDVPEALIEEETKLIGELIQQPNSLLVGAISSCRPEKKDMGLFIESAMNNPLIHGFRRVLHVVPDDVSTSDTFRQNIRALTRKGHSFDICVLPSQMHLAVALAKACPNTQFVLDHCGVPAVADHNIAPWKSQITSIARLPNVVCKISGLIAYGDIRRWLPGDIQSIVDDLRPYVEHAIDCFGWARVVWGSDFPVCNLTKGLAVWRAVTDELLQGCTPSQCDALAFANAKRIYRINQ